MTEGWRPPRVRAPCSGRGPHSLLSRCPASQSTVKPRRLYRQPSRATHLSTHVGTSLARSRATGKPRTHTHAPHATQRLCTRKLTDVHERVRVRMRACLVVFCVHVLTHPRVGVGLCQAYDRVWGWGRAGRKWGDGRERLAPTAQREPPRVSPLTETPKALLSALARTTSKGMCPLPAQGLH